MINKLIGTKDRFANEYELLNFIRTVFTDIVEQTNIKFVETPIFENSSLYKRSVEGSDIVKKEMYEFKDRANRDIALRPEGTAGFVRALIENKWYSKSLNNKYCYFGRMYRYERPQKGRLREFYQAGVEYVSDKINYYQDTELILTAKNLLDTLNIPYILKINSIGDSKTRTEYQNVLKEYLTQYKEQLNEVSQERLTGNVLRILDDKEDSEKDFVKKAPKINKFLSEESKTYFNNLTKLLSDMDINYQVDYSLVRGLDYYDEIVYEFVINDNKSGSQSTIIGGGRYSNLIKELGGPELVASGWGFGVDRAIDYLSDNEFLNSAIENEKMGVDLYIVSTTDDIDKVLLFQLANRIREEEIKVEFEADTLKSKKIFEKARKQKAKFVIFNDKLLSDNSFIAKDLSDNDRILFGKGEDGLETLLQYLYDKNLPSYVRSTIAKDLMNDDEDSMLDEEK